MYRNRWNYALVNAFTVLALNLVTRAIWWSDDPLFSWNVPLSLVLGYAVGHLIWPLIAWSNRKYAEKIAALEATHQEQMDLIEQARNATSERHYNEAMAKVEAFLNNPQTGVEIKRPNRKEQ